MTDDVPLPHLEQVTPRGTAVLSPPGTLRGRLQRGLGRGARAALDGADAVDLVLDCVCHDPRWDPQCESRARYYAYLMWRLAVPLDAVRAHLFSAEDVRPPDCLEPENFWRTRGTLEVLGALSAEGHVQARSLLRDYAVSGASWLAALDELAGDPDPAATGLGLAAAVLAQFDDETLVTKVDASDGPWSTWARTEPRVAEALRAREDEARRRHGRPLPDLRLASRDELVQLVLAKVPYRGLAIRELGRRRDTILLDWAEEEMLADEDEQVVDGVWRPMLFPGVFQALRRLPPELLLPRARDWAQRYPHHYQAVSILGEHGSIDDAPAVLSAYEAVLAHSDWDRGGDLPSGLARWDVVEAIPLLLGMWEATPHARARRELLTALARLSPDTAATLCGDALWDSQDTVREAAITSTAVTPPYADRLRELAQHPSEEPAVRRAAAARLHRERR